MAQKLNVTTWSVASFEFPGGGAYILDAAPEDLYGSRHVSFDYCSRPISQPGICMRTLYCEVRGRERTLSGDLVCLRWAVLSVALYHPRAFTAPPPAMSPILYSCLSGILALLNFRGGPNCRFLGTSLTRTEQWEQTRRDDIVVDCELRHPMRSR